MKTKITVLIGFILAAFFAGFQVLAEDSDETKEGVNAADDSTPSVTLELINGLKPEYYEDAGRYTVLRGILGFSIYENLNLYLISGVLQVEKPNKKIQSTDPQVVTQVPKLATLEPLGLEIGMEMVGKLGVSSVSKEKGYKGKLEGSLKFSKGFDNLKISYTPAYIKDFYKYTLNKFGRANPSHTFSQQISVSLKLTEKIKVGSSLKFLSVVPYSTDEAGFRAELPSSPMQQNSRTKYYYETVVKLAIKLTDALSVLTYMVTTDSQLKTDGDRKRMAVYEKNLSEIVVNIGYAF